MLMENRDEILKTLRVRSCEIHYMWIAELAIKQGPALVYQCMKVQFQGMRCAACLGVVFSLQKENLSCRITRHRQKM